MLAYGMSKKEIADALRADGVSALLAYAAGKLILKWMTEEGGG